MPSVDCAEWGLCCVLGDEQLHRMDHATARASQDS